MVMNQRGHQRGSARRSWALSNHNGGSACPIFTPKRRHPGHARLL